MGSTSPIEWTEATWNLVTGCTKISPGCKFCYAERLSNRLREMGNPKYTKGFELVVHPSALELPLSWRRPRSIFVNSMSDLFHEGVAEETIAAEFDVMRRASRHRFQVLTKRASRLAELAPRLPWPSNVWIGVSVENRDDLDRVDDLRRVPAAVRFLSIEPLLGPLGDVDLTGVDWAIVVGESGPGARPLDVDWVRAIRDRCVDRGVAFFFKQWGGPNKAKTGRTLDGRTWDEIPTAAVVPA